MPCWRGGCCRVERLGLGFRVWVQGLGSRPAPLACLVGVVGVVGVV